MDLCHLASFVSSKVGIVVYRLACALDFARLGLRCDFRSGGFIFSASTLRSRLSGRSTLGSFRPGAINAQRVLGSSLWRGLCGRLRAPLLCGFLGGSLATGLGLLVRRWCRFVSSNCCPVIVGVLDKVKLFVVQRHHWSAAGCCGGRGRLWCYRSRFSSSSRSRSNFTSLLIGQSVRQCSNG